MMNNMIELLRGIQEQLNVSLNVHMHSIMDYYISPGRFLTDKDRRVNADLEEIHSFFKPLDKLFGDYETRKKYNLHEELYRKNLEGKEAKISLCELKSVENKGKVIALYVISSSNELRIHNEWITVSEIKDAHTFILREGDEQLPVLEFYILDPVKLYQILELDKARLLTYKKALLDDLKIPHEEIYYTLIDKLVSIRLEQKKQREGEINTSDLNKIPLVILPNFEDITSDLKLNKENTLASAKLIYFAFRFDKVKIKNFEQIQDIRFRLGRFDDGRYVIYLHPYRSESNCPGRIPAE